MDTSAYQEVLRVLEKGYVDEGHQQYADTTQGLGEYGTFVFSTMVQKYPDVVRGLIPADAWMGQAAREDTDGVDNNTLNKYLKEHPYCTA